MAVILVMFVIAGSVTFSENSVFGEDDVPSSDPIRVGYVEGEAYAPFSYNLSGIALGLQELKLISGYDLSIDEPDARKIWDTLARSDSKGKFQFVRDMFFSMKTMDEADYARMVNSADVDILIVMGTVAGLYMRDHEQQNDFMVFASADAIQAGIIKSETERHISNSFACVDTQRLRRQIDVAYQMFKFRKIGVVYENSAAAYAYSGIGHLRDASKAEGFEVVERNVDESRNAADDERYYAELKAAYASLIEEGIDALYITPATTADEKIPWLLEDVVASKILTISQVGEDQVRSGALFGVTVDDPLDQGRFAARRLAAYMNGTPLREMSQVYEIVPRMYLNYDVCRKTGIKLTFLQLLSMDRIFAEGAGDA
jgi:ABC-type uncharacterized transport system substrate-binding protein